MEIQLEDFRPLLDKFWSDFHAFYETLPVLDDRFVYRGQADIDHHLIPSIIRPQHIEHDWRFQAQERKIINAFIRKASPLINVSQRPKSILGWIMLAQHYGLPTRLLDWTTNPYIALFFAVDGASDKDGNLYKAKFVDIVDDVESYNYATAELNEGVEVTDVFSASYKPDELCHYGEVIFVRPVYDDKRYMNQSAVLACPRDPSNSFADLDIENLVIPCRLKPLIKQQLRRMGIDYSFIYPGLDGVAKDLKDYMVKERTLGDEY